MKRVLTIVAGLLLLIIAGAWGYWTYRQYRSYQAPIPTGATSLARIGVDGLLVDIAWNALWHRSYYQGKQTEKPFKFDRSSWLRTGMAIPANIFVYQLGASEQEHISDVYFGSLALTDSTIFSQWLTRQPNLNIQRDTLGTVITSEHLVAVYDADRVFFALSPKKITSARPHIRNATQALMASRDWTTVDESPFHAIRKCDGDLVVLGAQQATIEFKNGQMLFSMAGTWKSRSAESRSAPQVGIPQFSSSNTASLWVAGLPAFLAGKTFELGPYTLAGDSLLKYNQGNVMIEWKGTVMQHDTVITYDYDDDFTMQERIELVEKPAPELYFSIATTDGLSDYLKAQGILTPQGVSQDALPLYHVGVNQIDRGFLQLHTAQTPSALPKQGPATDDVLYAHVNFEQIDSTMVSPLFIPYIQRLNQLEVTGRRSDGEHVTIRGTLFLRNPAIHSLVQLLN